MKRLALFICAALFSSFTNGQGKLLDVLPLSDQGRVLYSEVVQIDGVSKDELYNRAKVWFVNTFRSANDVIQLDDKEGGQIIGKGFSEVYWAIAFYGGTDVQVWYSVNIQVKDGRYRLQLTDYWLRAPETEATPALDTAIESWDNLKYRKENSKKFFIQVDEATGQLIESLKNAMHTPATSDDW